MTEAEFRKYFSSTKLIVLSAVRKYLPAEHHHLIDDVVQETYIRLINSSEAVSFPSEKSRSNFIYTVAKNESLRMAGKQRKEKIKSELFSNEELVKEDRSVIVIDEDIVHLKKAVSALPIEYRGIFKMVMDGKTEQQIAEKFSLKKGTVKSRIHRGKVLMRSLLKEAGYEKSL